MASALQRGWDFCARDFYRYFDRADARVAWVVLTAPSVLGTLWPCRCDGGGSAIAKRIQVKASWLVAE